ncbi:MAG: thioredoxin [Promethearchaeota archaeon]
MANYLRTALHEITDESDFDKVLSENEKVVVVCGRNGPMCLPVYGALETLQDKEKYKDISMNVMPFDYPISSKIKVLPEVRGFMGLPFTIYYRNKKVVKATSSIQEAGAIKGIFKEYLA